LEALSSNPSAAESARERIVLAQRELDREIDAYVKLPFFPGENAISPVIRTRSAPRKRYPR